MKTGDLVRYVGSSFAWFDNNIVEKQLHLTDSSRTPVAIYLSEGELGTVIEYDKQIQLATVQFVKINRIIDVHGRNLEVVSRGSSN